MVGSIKSPITGPARGGLAPLQVKRACERLESDLSGKLSLRQIAAEFGLSVSQFSRAFRISTGLPPYRRLLGQRVSAAERSEARKTAILNSALDCIITIDHEGSITEVIEDRPRQLIVKTERDPGDHVRVTVQDAGAGFNPQDADRLFDAFYTTKAGGMGIGLSVSRSIVENHRGRLWVTPNETHGASFSFSVPLGSENGQDQEIGVN